ncbi:MAG: hypothetical protein WCO35_03720 [Candidatus Nomurabacteria bacterium]
MKTGWIIGIVLFFLLASGQLNNLLGNTLNDYQGSDGMMHSGLIRLIIIGTVIYGLFKSPAGEVVKAAAGK